jgi:hypothetical protein
MSKEREQPRRRVIGSDDGERDAFAPVPIVDYSEVPRIRIYDGSEAGAYYYRRAGFTRRSIADD